MNWGLDILLQGFRFRKRAKLTDPLMSCNRKAAPDHHSMTVEIILIFWKVVLVFIIYNASKNVHFSLPSPQTVFSKILKTIQMFFCWRWVFLFSFPFSNGFVLATFPWMWFSPSLYPIAKSGVLILPEASESWGALNVVIGSLLSFSFSWLVAGLTVASQEWLLHKILTHHL